VGWQIVEWLRRQGEDIVALAIHPASRRRYGKQIVDSSGVDPSCIFDASRLDRPETLAAIKKLDPEIGISAFFGYILSREVLDLVPAGYINIHPALLPYNRGAYPNVWSIVDGTPAGVTIHYLDEGVDTGDIVAQRRVAVDLDDTGETLYRKLERAAVDLFKATWPLIRRGDASRVPQNRDAGTCHRVRDVERIDEIDLDRTYTARELINILRARTFPPHTGAYFRHGEQRIHLRLQLLSDAEQRQEKEANGEVPGD